MTGRRVTVAITALATFSVAGATVLSDGNAADDAGRDDRTGAASTAPSNPPGSLLGEAGALVTERPVSTLPVRSGTESTVVAVGPKPVGLRIPGLGVDAAIDDVGVDDQQRLEVPEVDRIGWYRFGARPGEPGATVLAGHVDFGGETGVFWSLAEAEVGDRVDVVLEDGSTRRYRVVDVTLYDKTELPNDELFRESGGEAVHLITCGGTFDRIQRSYRGNVVVTAVPLA